MSENQIKFQYEEGPNGAPNLASGMMATPMPDGRVLLRFFTEYPSVQKSETWRTEDGKLQEQVGVEAPCAQITRRIISSVIMDTNTVSGMVAALNNMAKNKGGNGGNNSNPPPGFRR